MLVYRCTDAASGLLATAAVGTAADGDDVDDGDCCDVIEEETIGTIGEDEMKTDTGLTVSNIEIDDIEDECKSETQNESIHVEVVVEDEVPVVLVVVLITNFGFTFCSTCFCTMIGSMTEQFGVECTWCSSEWSC